MQLAARWTGPPPKPKRPALAGTSDRAAFIGNGNTLSNTPADDAAQRAIAIGPGWVPINGKPREAVA